MVNRKNIYLLLILLLSNIIFANNMQNLNEIYLALNINKNTLLDSIIHEENDLISIGENTLGREIFLSKKCAEAWLKMQGDALKDSIHISILSGFRSYQKQYSIIKNKLNRGMPLSKILHENKLPGLSHHHSGNAIDIISNSYKLSLEFEKSSAYLWLIKNAHKYGFYLQYPKDNKSGIMFEPWHWYFKE